MPGPSMHDDEQHDSNQEDCSDDEEHTSLVEEKKDDESTSQKGESSFTSAAPSATNVDASRTTPTTPNTGLAFWERLPSKNLSFGSAEILTVDECVRHSALYQGRAVRVTGQLHQRTFVGDDIRTPRHVLLELIDPCTLMAQSSRAIPTNSPSNPNRTHTIPGVPSSTTTTPSTPSTVTSTPYKTPLKTLGLRKPSSSSTSLLANSSTCSSTKTPTSTLLSGKRKRPWFAISAKKKTPPKSLPRMLLKVIVDPELPRLATIVPSGASKVMVMGIILENGWLQARFVSLMDPTTDMGLYVNALHARRRCLYQRYKELTGTNTTPTTTGSHDNSKDDVVLIMGCGPPPYNYLDQEESK